MKKTLFFLIFALAALAASAQPLHLPRDVWRELDREQRMEVRQQIREEQSARSAYALDGDMFWIPIEESVMVPLPASMLASAEPNWSRPWLEVPQNEAAAKPLMKGKSLVFVLDTGEADHSEVRKWMLPGTSLNFTSDASVVDGHNHSTHVAGSIAATVASLPYGVAAMAAQEQRLGLIFYKVCTNGGSCSYTWVDAALKKVLELTPGYRAQGWTVFVNLSLGGGSSAAVESTLASLRAAGAITLAANGNNGQPVNSFPGSSENTLGIAALNQQGNRASFSNYGEQTFLAAPGQAVPSTCKGETVCMMSGTSMSTPQALGMLAYIAIFEPWHDFNTMALRAAALATDLHTPGWDRETGHGAPKLGKILAGIEPGPPPPDTVVPPPPPPPPPLPPPPADDFPGRSTVFSIDNPGTIAYQVANRPLNAKMQFSWVWGEPFGVMQDEKFVLPSESGWPDLQATRDFQVTRIVFEALAETEYNEAFRKAGDMARKFFRNRGFGLPAPADDYEAAKVAAYFFELVNNRFEGYPARVLAIECETPEGGKIIITGKHLWHWRETPVFDTLEGGEIIKGNRIWHWRESPILD
jgi:hypothetical protein